MAKTQANLQLIIVGPEFSQQSLREAGCSQHADRIHYKSGITDTQLRRLYASSELLIFPSLMEGFGWPIIEAQACGCAVATYDIEPMRSLNAIQDLVAGDGSEAQLLARVALNYIETTAEQKAQMKQTMCNFAAQFTNAASAKAYHELYQTAIEQQI